jgi:RNA polymerase sigma factor (sigma-70 family)
MIPHPDQRYIEALLQNDGRLIEEIYRRFSPAIRSWITKNLGSEADAADIFQESLVDIYHQAKHRSLQLTCPFEPFLLLVSRRKWLNILKKKGRSPVTKAPDDLSHLGEDVFREAEALADAEDRVRLFLQQFGRLGEKCREIIRRSLNGEKGEQLAAALGVTHGYLRKKKSECMATLLSYIQAQKPNYGR